MKKLFLSILSLALITGFGSSAASGEMHQPAAANAENMALIPGGEFWMGRILTNSVVQVIILDRDSRDDVPAHKIYVDAFFMDKHEITNEEYARFVEATGAAKPWYWVRGQIIKGEERHPVHYVNWSEAEGYCQWAGKRLP